LRPAPHLHAVALGDDVIIIPRAHRAGDGLARLGHRGGVLLLDGDARVADI
jgi:hypothetical protein